MNNPRPIKNFPTRDEVRIHNERKRTKMQFKDIPSDGGGEHFLKLKDGESIKGVLRGEIHDFRVHWLEKRSALCKSPQAQCALCDAGAAAKFRFRANFVTKDAKGEYQAKILEQGVKVYNALKAMHEAGYELQTIVIQITRTGSGMNDTVYAIMPVAKGELSAEQEAKIAQVKLHDLTEHGSEAQSAASGGLSDEEVPF